MYRKIGIAACSDPLKTGFQKKMGQLQATLQTMDIDVVFSPYIYDRGDGFAGTAKERAEALMAMYRDPEIEAICDLSGGDMANAVLPYLDFACIQQHPKLFWGYSDLTTILNAVYAKTGQIGVLYQLRNLIYDDAENQKQRFSAFVEKTQLVKRSNEATDPQAKHFAYTPETDDPGAEFLTFPHTFVQGKQMEGVLIGGNIRCFLKLAGTSCIPDFSGKILLLEAMGGGVSQMVTYLAQLKMLGAFEKSKGILLGTFTRMEENREQPDMISLVREIAGWEIPIAKTAHIGHGSNSRAALIGGYYVFEDDRMRCLL